MPQLKLLSVDYSIDRHFHYHSRFHCKSCKPYFRVLRDNPNVVLRLSNLL